MMNYDTEKKHDPLQKAMSLAREWYDLDAQAFELPGEIDHNYLLKTQSGQEYVLKISRPGSDPSYLLYQQELLSFLHDQKIDMPIPSPIRNRSGELISVRTNEEGHKTHIRLLKWIPGRLYSQVNPKTNRLRHDLGRACGKLTEALQEFDHPGASRVFDWNLADALWTKKHQDLFDSKEREITTYFQTLFEAKKADYEKLRKSIVHNDANDNNVVVSNDLANPEVITIIDFGDAVHTQTINDLAVACAYGIMNTADPLDACTSLVRGYHEAFPLMEEELEHLFACIGMRLVISVTKSAINKRQEPENEYLQISEKPAWELLRKWREIHPRFALYHFREACGFTSHPKEDSFNRWCSTNQWKLEDLFPEVGKKDCAPIDLSVGSNWLGLKEDFADFERFDLELRRLQWKHPEKIMAGGYLEPRMVYSTAAYEKIGNEGKENRSVHLGVDFWLPAGTSVNAPMDGCIAMAVNDAGDKEYGGLVVIEHDTDQYKFYTLYGHLNVSHATRWNKGQQVKKGDRIAELGDYPENGNWPPHLHFQVILDLMELDNDFPGVAFPKQTPVWKSICPDPNLLFRLDGLKKIDPKDQKEILVFRKKHLGRDLSLSYEEPLHIVRGDGAYLADANGKRYLDTVNNVAHVGHEHYRVVKAGQRQMAVLNTNSRYLHENMELLARELMDTLPKELSVFYFVNSGSEANELALRMIKTATGEKDVIASEVGYHGNSNACVEISSYKFDGKGGQGCPENTFIIPIPDTFRGKYRGAQAGTQYADEVDLQIQAIEKKGRKPAGFIIEPIISCGGQVELPEGFLKSAYKKVRKAGGYCISDEVQTGCGRMGSTFWGFQLHDVVPDIVTIGKPLGNGHPVAAVACTPEIADKFQTGMEFFNTFGGNPVSCAIATEVLKTVRDDRLQENALMVGNYLKEKLKELAVQYPVLADIRGQGLFLGMELCGEALCPLEAQATYLVNRMKAFGFLMSTDGPDHNVIKIKPPMVFSKDNARDLLLHLEMVLQEDFMKI